MRKIMLAGVAVVLAAFFGAAALVTFIALQTGEKTKLQTEPRRQDREASVPTRGVFLGDVEEAFHLVEAASVSREEAERAILGETPGEILEIDLDSERGGPVYEVEVFGSDGVLREASVDARSGEVFDAETQDPDEAKKAEFLGRRAGIGREEAEEATLDLLPGQIVESGLEEENGYIVYNIEVLGEDGSLHETFVDALSGRLLHKESRPPGESASSSGD